MLLRDQAWCSPPSHQHWGLFTVGRETGWKRPITKIAKISDNGRRTPKIHHGPFRIWRTNLRKPCESEESDGANLRNHWGFKAHLPCAPIFLNVSSFFNGDIGIVTPTQPTSPSNLGPPPGQCNWEQSAATLLQFTSWRTAHAARLRTIPRGGQTTQQVPSPVTKRPLGSSDLKI